jgi:hypothetical protein
VRVPPAAALVPLAPLAGAATALALLAFRDGHGRDSREVVPLPPPAVARPSAPPGPGAGGEVLRRLDGLAREVGELRAVVMALARGRAGAPPGPPPEELAAPEEGASPTSSCTSMRPARPPGCLRFR